MIIKIDQLTLIDRHMFAHKFLFQHRMQAKMGGFFLIQCRFVGALPALLLCTRFDCGQVMLQIFGDRLGYILIVPPRQVLSTFV